MRVRQAAAKHCRWCLNSRRIKSVAADSRSSEKPLDRGDCPSASETNRPNACSTNSSLRIMDAPAGTPAVVAIWRKTSCRHARTRTPPSVFASLPQSEERQESDDDNDGTDNIDDSVHEHFLRVEGVRIACKPTRAIANDPLLRPDALCDSAQTIPRRFSNIYPCVFHWLTGAFTLLRGMRSW